MGFSRSRYLVWLVGCFGWLVGWLVVGLFGGRGKCDFNQRKAGMLDFCQTATQLLTLHSCPLQMIVMDSSFASMIAILLFLCGIGPPLVSIADCHSNPGEQMKPWRAGRLQLFRNILTIFFYSSNQARYNRAVFFSLFCYAGKSCPCLLYTSPSPRDLSTSRMPSSA